MAEVVLVELSWEKIKALYDVLLDLSYKETLSEMEEDLLTEFEDLWEDRP